MEAKSNYDLGYAVGLANKYPDCPFKRGTKEYDDWWSGYDEGYGMFLRNKTQYYLKGGK